MLWFTGLSGAGKSTIANLSRSSCTRSAATRTCSTATTCGTGSTSDLGFTDADRVENIRRVAEVAQLMVDAGLIVLVASSRRSAPSGAWRASCSPSGEFFEVYVDTPLAVAEERDVKGLYKKARRGELKNFTGIDSPYEAPENPEIYVDTTQSKAEESAAAIIEHLRRYGRLGAG